MGKTIDMKSKSKNSSKKDDVQDVKEYTLIKLDDLKDLSVEEIDKKRSEFEKEAESLGKKIQTKQYRTHFGTRTNLVNLKKYIEKEIKWDHKSAPTYVAVFDGIKKALEEGLDEDGYVGLNSLVVGHLYQYMLTMSGQGITDAKKYLTLLTKVGEPISMAMRELASDNQYFTNVHNDLSTLDTALQAKKQGIDIDEVKEQQELQQSMSQGQNPNMQPVK